MKKCSSCKQEKEKKEFGKRQYSPDGLKARCKTCESKALEKRRQEILRRREFEIV